MHIRTTGDHFQVKSDSSNRWYDVYPERPFCSCPNFLFRSVKGGGVCKHIVAVREHESQADGQVLEYVRQRGEVDSVELIQKFGEEAVNAMIARGEILEKAGKIRILE